MIIAIDGPAASGKGTLARRLAAHFGLPHLDTGLLYRGVAGALLGAGCRLDDPAAAAAAARALDLRTLDEARLRGREMGEAASVVSAFPAVREALLELQRCFAGRQGGAVLDGRDIGTIVCPGADVKLFVTASAAVRAERRHRELLAAGESGGFEAVLADICRRDARDSSRRVAPLRPAEDAVVLDTTNLDAEAAFRAALDLVAVRRGGALGLRA